MYNPIYTLAYIRKMERPSEELRLFIAYSRKDKEILDKLNIRLKILKNAQLVDQIWYDELISPGNEWDKEIKKALEAADVILILVTYTFLASDYAYNEELMRAIEYHKRGKKSVIPIIARHCSWTLTPIKDLEVLPKGGCPLVNPSWGTEDIPYHQVTEQLTTLFGNIKEAKRKNLKRYHYQERILKADG